VKQSENILRNRVEKYLKKLVNFKTDMSIIDSKRRNTMETEGLLFKKEFLKLVKKYPCSMGYYFQDQIDEFENNHRPKEKANCKTINSLVESIKKFAKKYPKFKILPADDSYSFLHGYVVYIELDGKEIAHHLTISPHNTKDCDLKKLLKEKFNDHFEQ